MFCSISFHLALAILGSLIKTSISGPLDCISGPCVTVEGVGEPQFNPCQIQICTDQILLSQLFQFHPNLSQSIKFKPILSDRNLQAFRQAARKEQHILWSNKRILFHLLYLFKPVSINLHQFIQNQSHSHLRQAPRQLGEHSMVSQENQPVHGNSFRRNNSRRIQVLILSMMQHYQNGGSIQNPLCFRFAPPRAKAPLNDGNHNIYDASYFSWITNWQVS